MKYKQGLALLIIGFLLGLAVFYFLKSHTNPESVDLSDEMRIDSLIASNKILKANIDSITLRIKSEEDSLITHFNFKLDSLNEHYVKEIDFINSMSINESIEFFTKYISEDYSTER